LNHKKEKYWIEKQINKIYRVIDCKTDLVLSKIVYLFYLIYYDVLYYDLRYIEYISHRKIIMVNNMSVYR